jgi:hypothetical protein
MIVYILTRNENGETSVYPPFESQDMASAAADTHIRWRVGEGDTIHRETRFSPENTKVRTPKNTETLDVSCVVREVELCRTGGGRTIYRITQHPVIEDEAPFLLTVRKISHQDFLEA